MTARRLFVLLAMLGCGVAQAQGLADPTRPPAELLSGGVINRTASPASALQSIILSKGRKIAVINGQSIPLGGKYGDATLVGISPAEVTLRGDKGTEVMKLYPAFGRSAPSAPSHQAVKGAGK